jgi:hypothetical protein
MVAVGMDDHELARLSRGEIAVDPVAWPGRDLRNNGVRRP